MNELHPPGRSADAGRECPSDAEPSQGLSGSDVRHLHPSQGLSGSDVRHLHPRHLRALLTLAVRDAGRTVTVSELVEVVAAEGFVLRGRPGKTVSDALRSPVTRGWVRRVGRGRYAPGRLAKVTLHRQRARVAEARRQLAERHRALGATSTESAAVVAETGTDGWRGGGVGSVVVAETGTVERSTVGVPVRR